MESNRKFRNRLVDIQCIDFPTKMPKEFNERNASLFNKHSRITGYIHMGKEKTSTFVSNHV